MGAISAESVRRSEAQFQPKQPWTEMVTPLAPSSPSTLLLLLLSRVMLEVVMAQLKRMDARFDTLTTELYEVNTRVSRIAQRNAHISGFTTSPSSSPSLEAFEDKDADDGSNDEDARYSSDEGMTTSL